MKLGTLPVSGVCLPVVKEGQKSIRKVGTSRGAHLSYVPAEMKWNFRVEGTWYLSTVLMHGWKLVGLTNDCEQVPWPMCKSLPAVG